MFYSTDRLDPISWLSARRNEKSTQKDKHFLNKPLLKNSDQCYSGERETMGSSAANIIKLDQRSGDIQCRPDISNVRVNTYCDKVACKGHSSFSMASSKLEIVLLAVTIYNLRWRLITCKLGVFLSWFWLHRNSGPFSVVFRFTLKKKEKTATSSCC